MGKVGSLKNSWASKRRITWSVVEKWMSCRRRWFYRYVGQFSPPSGMPLLEGRAFHEMFEDEARFNMLIQKEGWSCADAEAIARRKYIEEYVENRITEMEPILQKHRNEALKPFLTHTPGVFNDSPVKYREEDVESSIKLIRGVFGNWLRAYGAEDIRRYKFLGSEIFFDDLIIPKPGGGKLKGWRLGGVIDALLEDRNTGQLVLRELKSTGGDASNYEKRVDLDPQVRLYALAAQLAGLTNGRAIEAVQYIVLRKKIPSTPKSTTCFGCRGKEAKIENCHTCHGVGLVPSADKRIDTTRDVFLKHLEGCWFAEKMNRTREREGFLELYPNNPNDPIWLVHQKYFDLVSSLKGWEKFISVNTYWLSQQDKEEALFEAYQASREISDAVKRYQRKKESYITCFPRNINKCCGPAGFCEYKQICLARADLESLAIDSSWDTNLPDNPEILELQQKGKENENFQGKRSKG